MRRAAHSSIVGLAMFLVCLPLIYAGGPLYPGFGEGRYFQWEPEVPVRYTLDPGPLSDLVSPSASQQLMHSATQAWNEIETSTFLFQDNGLLPEDITVNNFVSFFGLNWPMEQQPVRPENPVVFDEGGAIIDDYLGFNASQSVIGFAGARFVDNDSRRFISGWVVLNGRFASASSFSAAVVHELGHLLGLDHSQGMQENAELGSSYLDDRYVPLMYPFSFSPLQPKKPIRDEIAWISWMYPDDDFSASTGTISGKVFRRSGAPFLGANVVAVKVDEEGTLLLDEIVSVVSDFLDLGTGEFIIPGLVPGDYHVFIEPLESDFIRTEGHGVGPHDYRPTNFPKDYYDGNESADEDPTQKLVMTVGAGEELSGVNLIANEMVNRLDLLEDDDEMLFVFPEGFSFPFFGEVYSQVVVNSDGNLTFREGDGKVGDARTELRFLSGPPRIAPMFADMDPSAGGEIRAVEGEGAIQFIWDRVPEFDDVSVRPPNTFSVTLFSNGDVLFDYQETSLTPDFSEIYLQGLQAIVGVSPGSLQSGNGQDLSAGSRTFEFDGVPIYQVFPGETLDLDGVKLLFQSDSTAFYIPFYSGGNLSGQLGDLQQFTGFAVTNFGDQETDLLLEARDSAGTLLGFTSNPGSESIQAEGQIAKLGNEVFDIGFSEAQAGWIRLKSTQPEVASFFMIGNGLSGPQNRLDGSIAVRQQSQKIYFTRLYEGSAVFPSNTGNRAAKTFVSLANPNGEEISVTLRQVGPDGTLVRQVVRSVEALGVLTESLSALFNSQTSFANGFIEAEVDGPGAVGFELIEVGDTLMGLNAVSDTSSTDSYSAQLAHGDGSIFTSLKLVNTTGMERAVTLTAFILKPEETVVTREIALGAWKSLQQTAGEVFDLDGSTSLVEGSLRVECPGGGVIGDVIFGDPNTVKYAAALALQSTPFKRAVFSQISNAGDAFTGLAFLNPNASEVQIDVEVYDRNGQLVGDAAQVVLGPWERISRLLEDEETLVPESANLIGGYIIVSASKPIVGQELFGNATLDYLAAVPPEVIE